MITILTALSVALILAAAIHDVAARTIPNAVPAALVCDGLGMTLMAGHLLWSLLTATVVFIAALLCWRRGWLGGGDVKLLGAAAFVVSPAAVPAFIASVAIGGGA